MRWRLTAPHYLNVPGTEWEHKETNRDTGKQMRKVYPVPLLLEPDSPSDCNYPGEVIVCYEGKGLPRDYVFTGEPTPDMEPMDDEAQALSDSLRHKWQHPIEGLANEPFATGLIAQFEQMMAKVMANQAPQPVAVGGVDPSAFALMQEQLAALMARNAELEAVVPARRA